jgi:hypothetical protein
MIHPRLPVLWSGFRGILALAGGFILGVLLVLFETQPGDRQPGDSQPEEEE